MSCYYMYNLMYNNVGNYIGATDTQLFKMNHPISNDNIF